MISRDRRNADLYIEQRARERDGKNEEVTGRHRTHAHVEGSGGLLISVICGHILTCEECGDICTEGFVLRSMTDERCGGRNNKSGPSTRFLTSPSVCLSVCPQSNLFRQQSIITKPSIYPAIHSTCAARMSV